MLNESFPGVETERDEAIGEVGDIVYGEDEVDPLLLSQGHTPSEPKPGPNSGTFDWHEFPARIYSRIVARKLQNFFPDRPPQNNPRSEHRHEHSPEDEVGMAWHELWHVL